MNNADPRSGVNNPRDRMTPGAQTTYLTPMEAESLKERDFRRYSRHLLLPEVGEEGQTRLKGAKTLVVGAGGLGSPSILYLAAAGVGTIGIADFDAVEESNLQRQIIHGTAAIGTSKLDSAARRVADLNPDVRVVRHAERLTSRNAIQIVDGYDIVLDGSDNFPTRYLMNDACVLSGKPNVYGSIFRFEGQVSVFDARKGPCYRCLFRDPPPPDLVPSCAEGGVLGVLPGIIGSMQALEAIKLILGAGETLTGRLLLFDALAQRTREISLNKDPECAVCGEHPTVTELIDYDQFCNRGRRDDMEISVKDLKAALDGGERFTLVDVREPHERRLCKLNDQEFISLGNLDASMNTLAAKSSIVFYCHSGVRSLHAVRMAEHAGITGTRSLRGGIDAWSLEIDRSIPRY